MGAASLRSPGAAPGQVLPAACCRGAGSLRLRGPGVLTGETPWKPHCRPLGSDCPLPSLSWAQHDRLRTIQSFLQDSEKLLRDWVWGCRPFFPMVPVTPVRSNSRRFPGALTPVGRWDYLQFLEIAVNCWSLAKGVWAQLAPSAWQGAGGDGRGIGASENQKEER